MGKPWARLELNFLNHAKFLALHANAICLWLEGKNYCDVYHTDGLFPREALKTFRFYSRKSEEQLTRSCGPKTGTEAGVYAPLWEPLDLGGVRYLRMHDYLDHNDCRDEVLARLEDAEDRAELRRLKDSERKKRERIERKSALDKLRTVRGQTADESMDGPADVHTQTETETETEADLQDLGNSKVLLLCAQKM